MFIPGSEYHKADIYIILSVPKERQKGSWNTGYARYGGAYYIFANIGIAGRTGHDYDNKWENEEKNVLIWYGKNRSHLGQKSIKELLDRRVLVHIFTREEERGLFCYRGLGMAREYKEVENKPIMIVWDIIKTEGERDVDEKIEDIIIHTEAPNDILKKWVAYEKRVRDGQKKLKDGLIKLYGKCCCITACTVEEVLMGCHIEPHKERGNNHSTNGLLLRADVHILFDKNLIGIEPDTLTVRIAEKLRGSEYEYLDGRTLRARKDGERPDRKALEERWREFEKTLILV